MPEELGPETPELQEQVIRALEKEVEEVKQERDQDQKERQWLNYIGLSTAIVSALAAIAAMQGGSLSNEAALTQMKANDQWGLFQAKSTKRHIEESTATLLKALQKPVPISVTAEVKKLNQEQQEIKTEAEKLQAESLQNLHRHELFARSVAALQISISLSAIAALLRKKVVWYLSMGIAVIGISSMITGTLASAANQSHSTEHSTSTTH